MKIHEIIMELGDSPLSYTIIRNTNRTFIAASGDIEVEFSAFPRSGHLEILFSVADKMSITGKGEAIKVFSTVGKIISDNINMFLEKNPLVDKVWFSADSKEPSRIRLYDKFAPYISKILGADWSYTRMDLSNGIRYNWNRTNFDHLGDIDDID